jgi:hypothetical protein
MAKEYATVQIHNGAVLRVDIGATHGSPQDVQFDGLKGHPLVAALNKLDELGYAPHAGVVSFTPAVRVTPSFFSARNDAYTARFWGGALASDCSRH